MANHNLRSDKVRTTLKDRHLDPFSIWNDKVFSNKIRLHNYKDLKIEKNKNEEKAKSLRIITNDINQDSSIWMRSGESILVNNSTIFKKDNIIISKNFKPSLSLKNSLSQYLLEENKAQSFCNIKEKGNVYPLDIFPGNIYNLYYKIKDFKMSKSQNSNQNIYLGQSPVQGLNLSEVDYIGYGEEVWKSESNTSLKYNHNTENMKLFEDRLQQLFVECNPNENGYILKETLLNKIYDNYCDTEIPSMLYTSLKDLFKDKDETLNYDTFYHLLGLWVENFLYKNELSSEFEEEIRIGEKHCLSLMHTSSPQQDDSFQFSNGYELQSKNEFVECEEKYRRSTLLPGGRPWISNIGCDLSFPSPIKLKKDCEEPIIRKIIDNGLQEQFDYTYGSIETEANVTPLDPIELQQEVFELTFANQKLLAQNEKLAGQLSKSDDEYQNLKEVMKKLEQQNITQQQRHIENEEIISDFDELKSQIQVEKEKHTKTKNLLIQVENELSDFTKKYNDELDVCNEKLDKAIKKERELNNQIQDYIDKIKTLTAELKETYGALELKDINIFQYQETIMDLKVKIEISEEQKLHILEEFYELKHQLNDNLPTLREVQENFDETCLYEEITACINEDFSEEITFKESDIKYEICSMDTGNIELPFCGKDENSFSPVISIPESDDFETALNRWRQWGDRSIDLAKELMEDGKDSYQLDQICKLHNGIVQAIQNVMQGKSPKLLREDSHLMDSKENEIALSSERPREHVPIFIDLRSINKDELVNRLDLKNWQQDLLNLSLFGEKISQESSISWSFPSHFDMDKQLLQDHKIFEYLKQDSLKSTLKMIDEPIKRLGKKDYYGYAILGIFISLFALASFLNNWAFELPTECDSSKYYIAFSEWVSLYLQNTPVMRITFTGFPPV